MTLLGRTLCLVGLGSLGIILDQVTKIAAVSYLKGETPIRYLWDTTTLLYTENTGAWGGLGGSLPEFWRQVLLIILPAIVLGVVALYVIRKDQPKWDVIMFTLLISGGVGNLLDRVFLGYVVDFMHIGIGSIGTNVFNVADMLIMTGMIYLIIKSIFFTPKESKAES